MKGPGGPRVQCRHCGRMILVNQDGSLRHHFAPEGGWRRGGSCPGSRTPACAGAVTIRELQDGVVVKVRHAPGVMADEAVTDELVLTQAEWRQLAAAAAVAVGARLRPLAASWRSVAASLAPHAPDRAADYRYCANDLERALREEGHDA